MGIQRLTAELRRGLHQNEVYLGANAIPKNWYQETEIAEARYCYFSNFSSGIPSSLFTVQVNYFTSQSQTTDANNCDYQVPCFNVTSTPPQHYQIGYILW
jgi:hypothetical protein